jgi:hypothetical protein
MWLLLRLPRLRGAKTIHTQPPRLSFQNIKQFRIFRLGPAPRRILGPAAASIGRTPDRTRPMLHQHQKVLAMAPSTHDPEQTFGMNRINGKPRDCRVLLWDGPADTPIMFQTPTRYRSWPGGGLIEAHHSPFAEKGLGPQRRGVHRHQHQGASLQCRTALPSHPSG